MSIKNKNLSGMRFLSLIFTMLSLLFCSELVAQKDTTIKQSVTVISAYKPVLMNVAKINFSATNLATEAVKEKLNYDIPDQALIYMYAPITLKPLAFNTDTAMSLGNHFWVKAGIGNYATPVIAAGACFRNKKELLVNIYGDYISSKGKMENQNYSMFSLKGTGSYFFPNTEAYASLEMKQRQFYLYGYNHDLYKYNKNEISQQFQEMDFKAGFRNTKENALKVDYDANMQFNYFTGKDAMNETTLRMDLPAERKINELFTLKADAMFDLTNSTTKNINAINYSYHNNMAQFSPSLIYQTSLYKINGGVNAIWDNSKLVILPNIFGELKIKNFPFVLQGGFIGKLNKNTYRNMSYINPYISSLKTQTNTLETEYYGGLKTNLSNRIVASAKVGWVSYNNYQFIINDTAANADGKSFVLSNEDKVNNFKLHGNISYTIPGKLYATGGITLNAYAGMKANEKAWHTLPMECTAAVQWNAFKKLVLKGDFYMFGGGHYLEKDNKSGSLKGGVDLSLGGEYKITNKINAFVDLNNIFGDKYQRWHNYPVYGICVLAGVIIRF